jgi:hypothetical protein
MERADMATQTQALPNVQIPPADAVQAAATPAEQAPPVEPVIHRGDWFALLIWVSAFLIMMVMNLQNLIAGLFH